MLQFLTVLYVWQRRREYATSTQPVPSIAVSTGILVICPPKLADDGQSPRARRALIDRVDAALALGPVHTSRLARQTCPSSGKNRQCCHVRELKLNKVYTL